MSGTDYVFAPEERSQFPGSPYTPVHSAGRRVAYASVGILIGTLCYFTNALVNVNAGNLAGSLDLTLAQVSVLPAIFIAMNATGNLSIVRARSRYGIPAWYVNSPNLTASETRKLEKVGKAVDEFLDKIG